MTTYICVFRPKVDRFVPLAVEVAPRRNPRSAVYGSPARDEQNQVVEEFKCPLRRRVYNSRHGEIRVLRQRAQRVDERVASHRVQPRRRLVEEERLRARHELHADARALLLAAGNVLAAVRRVRD